MPLFAHIVDTNYLCDIKSLPPALGSSYILLRVTSYVVHILLTQHGLHNVYFPGVSCFEAYNVS